MVLDAHAAANINVRERNVGAGELIQLLFAIPYTLVAWFDPPSLRRYKVQDTPFDIGKWLWPSVGRLAVNVLIVAVVLVLIWPLLRLSPIHQGEMPAWYVVIAQLPRGATEKLSRRLVRQLVLGT